MNKIGVVVPWYGDNIPGGAETAIRGIIKHLQADGVNIEVLTTCVEKFASNWNVNFHKEGETIEGGVKVRRFKVRKGNHDIFNAINYKLMNGIPLSEGEDKRFLEESINSDKLYAYMNKNKDQYSLFIFIPYMFGTTYNGAQVCPEKSVLIPCFHDESYAYLDIFKGVFSKVAGMIFHADPEKKLAEQIYDLRNVNGQVLGDGIDTHIKGDRDRFIKKYKINEPFIIYAGRKEIGKNVPLLLRYFEEYKKNNTTNLKLVFIGGGEIEIPKSIKRDIIDLGFIPIQDKHDAYAAAEMLCQPSINESFSIVIMESWLASRPVLVHDQCEVTKHFVKMSNGGLYFNDYYEFEKEVDYILMNKEKANIMGKQGREFVVENFSWEVIVKKYRDYFMQITGGY